MSNYFNNRLTGVKTPFLMSLYYILCMLYSLHAHIFWHVDNTVITLAILLFTVVIHFFHAKYYTYEYFGIAVFAIIAVILGTKGNLNGYLFNVISIIPFLSFVFLKKEYKYGVFNAWRTVFCVIIGVSLFFYLLILAQVELPYTIDYYGDVNSDSFYSARNYFVLVQLSNWYTDIALDRFQSIFLEPGYLACLIAMMLFIDGYSFRKRKSNLLLLIALFLTFSLAGFLLFTVFYLVRVLKNSKYRFVSMTGLILLIFSIYVYGTNHNGGDNLINQFILERLQYDSDRGTIEGYNRTTEAFDEYFSEFIFTPSVVLGDAKVFESRFAGDGANVGIKYYIVVYGLVGLFSYILFLLSPFFKMVRKTYLTSALFVLWFIIFARGNFVMWMSAFLITYIYGLLILNEQE